MFQPRKVSLLFVNAGKAWLAHRAPSMGAAIAFYTLFSMAPVGMVALAVVGSVYGEDMARHDLLQQIQTVLGNSAATAIATVLDSTKREGDATWHTVLAIVTSLFTATTVFAELKDSLDIIWDTPPRQHSSWWEVARRRLLSFGIVISLGFVLLASMLVSTVISALGDRYGYLFGGWVLGATVATNLIGLFVVTLLFAAIFGLLPERRTDMRFVWHSALLTAALYMLGKGLIAQYLGTTALASSYGAAGALVLVLVWVYYSAQIFLYGAELSRQMTLTSWRQGRQGG